MKIPTGLALAALAMLLLAGCATKPVSQLGATISADVQAVKAVVQAKVLNPLNDKTVLALGATLSAANSAIIAYGALPLCPSGQPAALGETGPDGKLCHDKAIFHTMHADAVVAVGAYAELQAAQRAHPQGSVLIGGTLHDKFATVQSAISAVTDLVNAYAAAQVKE